MAGFFKSIGNFFGGTPAKREMSERGGLETEDAAVVPRYAMVVSPRPEPSHQR